MKSSLMLAGLAGSLVFAAAAEAQHRGHQGRGDNGPARAMMMLRAADANADNHITRTEVETLQAEMFEWMDRNGDGYLSSDDRSPVHQRLAALREAEGGELHERRRGRHGAHRQDRDADGDGRISRAEFLGGENRGFERLDANNDDVITPDELEAAVETARERREGRRFWWRD
ncbi:hypothetical protein [Hyphobacterium sp.]|uniref:hypothetical protein n=1 Tax=Hyphobacterium sp. TaxID=2004662 RepID=UPI003BAD30B4